MQRRDRSQRIVVAAAAALVAGFVLGSSDVRVAAEPNVVLDQVEGTPVDASSALVAAEVAGAAPSVSGDGRYVVFQGAPPVEVEGAAPVARDRTIYLADRTSGDVIELSPVPAGIRAGDTILPVISGDGCVVAALTEMPLDVFRDDDLGERWDVYRTVLPHCDGEIGDWELVSTRQGAGGLARDDVAVDRPAIDRGGTLVAYTHPADHYFEAREVTAISLTDLAVPSGDPNRTRFAAGLPADMPDNPFEHSGLDQPAFSDDGRFLAYRSSATSADPVPGWAGGPVEGGPATTQVYVWDRFDADPFTAVRLVSRDATGEPPTAGASSPDIDRDGSVVVYTSTDLGIVPDARYPVCTDNCPEQVFVVDRDPNGDGVIDGPSTQRTSLVSATPDDDGDGLVAGTAPSLRPALSGNGQLAAFVTKAPNLQLVDVPSTGSGPDGDLLLAQLDRGTLDRLTVTPTSAVVPVAGVHANPALSDTGRTAVFDSAAADQLTGTIIDPPVVDDADDAEVATDELGASLRRVVARSLPPQLSLPDADLGTTVVGLESDEWYVAVVNDGPSSFLPAEVTISDPHFAITPESSSCLLGAAIPAGGSCTVALTFTPTQPGPSTAVLRVAEAGFDAVAIESNIAGAGGEPTLRIDPAGADLGVVTVGDSGVELLFDVSNIAPMLPTRLVRFDVGGAHAQDFAITTNACADRPLNPRASCSVGITFTPSDAGRRTALVTLGTPSGQYATVVLAGDGRFEPTVTLSGAEVDAGDAFTATADGFEANTEVTVVFSDDPSHPVTAQTDAEGKLFVQLEAPAGDPGGDRTIVVQTDDGVAATSRVDVRGHDDAHANAGMPGFGLG